MHQLYSKILFKSVETKPSLKPSSLQLGLILAISLLFSFNASFADDYTSPELIAGTTKIDAESLIKLAREQEDLVIIDSRINADRRHGFITGSTSLPDTETNCLSLMSIIESKNTPLVFYCNGPKCRRSDLAVTIAIQCGYDNIYWFRGGFEEWQYKKYLYNK